MEKTLLLNNEIYLYGDVGDPWGWGDGFTPDKVARALVDHGPGDVTVRLNSGGGLAFDGMAIYSLLKAHSGKITIAIDGVAASAASLIAMAGDDIQMRRGAMMMIHDPSAYTHGTSADHQDAAARLDKLADNYASVYAARAKIETADVRALMLATTWLSADEAVEKGFASAVLTDVAVAMAAFDYRLYANAPAGMPVRPRPEKQAAQPVAQKEAEPMTTKTDPVVTTTASTPPASAAAGSTAADKPKAWAAGFYAAAGTSGLALAKLNEIVAASDTHDAAKDALIVAMSAARDANKPNPQGGHAQVAMGADAREKFVEGVTRAITFKVPSLAVDGERNEFSGRRMFEIARMSLELSGRGREVFRDDFAMIGAAMAPVIMSGAMSTSDFVNILANVANKSMLKGYDEASETFKKWTATGTLADFKTVSRVDLGMFPALDLVPEGAEYNYAKLSDRGVTLALATYGKMFPITRQAIINDDLNAFTKVPSKMGAAAHRTVGNLVYAILTANANMADGNALFSTQHKNKATGAGSALGVTALDAARSSMAKQQDKDAAAVALNIRPSFLLVPVALQGAAHQLMASQTEPGQSNAALANRVANMAEVISDARLDLASATGWYLVGSPAQYDTIEVSYLNGVAQPVLEQKEGWNVDGVEFKVRHDAGVNLLDYIAMYFGAGA